MKSRQHAIVRERASAQLRQWGASGAAGLNDCAFEAMVRAAIRLGFPGIEQCCSAGAWPDMMSEAIEDVESPN